MEHRRGYRIIAAGQETLPPPGRARRGIQRGDRLLGQDDQLSLPAGGNDDRRTEGQGFVQRLPNLLAGVPVQGDHAGAGFPADEQDQRFSFDQRGWHPRRESDLVIVRQVPLPEHIAVAGVETEEVAEPSQGIDLTTGLEKPQPTGTRQRTCNPSSGNLCKTPDSAHTPSRPGPRHCGQSSARSPEISAPAPAIERLEGTGVFTFGSAALWTAAAPCRFFFSAACCGGTRLPADDLADGRMRLVCGWLAPAGWLHESGRGLPQSKAGFSRGCSVPPNIPGGSVPPNVPSIERLEGTVHRTCGVIISSEEG